MRELLDFIVRNSKWFVFILFVVLSCILLFSGNPYQHHVYLTSANAVSSSIFRLTHNVTSYFNLRHINDGLNERNAALEAEVIKLRQQIRDINDATLGDTIIETDSCQYTFIVAHVINNSVAKPYNYLTINKGRADGIRPGMGVINQQGVIGSVNVVAEHSARVISVLNPMFHVSCKLKDTQHFGSLSWDGVSPRRAILEDMPRHAQIKAGDSIVTTGFSAVFPPDIMVATVLPPPNGKEYNVQSIEVKLSTDFSTLNTVQVVVNSLSEEMFMLEESDNNVYTSKIQ